MSSDRFKELKEVDERSKDSLEKESDEGEGTTDSTSSSGSTGTTGSTSTSSGTSSSSSTGGNSSSSSKEGNVKDRNPRMSMFPPKEHKEGCDGALRKVKAICSLANEPEPSKLSEFSGAVLKHVYNNLEGICEELELKEAYGEYGEIVQE